MKKNLLFMLTLCMILPVLISACTPKHDHTYNETVTKQPTCKDTGIKTYTCTICNKKYTEEIPVSNNHDYQEEITKEPTCLEVGEKTYTCSVCGKSNTTEVAATGHMYESKVIKEATCTKKGSEKKTCTVCGESNTQETPAKGHSWKLTSSKDATCTKDGKKEWECSECGKTKTEKIAKTGHTAKSDGFCSKCGKDTYRTITVGGVHFKVPQTLFTTSSVYDKRGCARITDIKITIEDTYDSYSRFYVVYSAEKIGGEEGWEIGFDYVLLDSEGYTMSGGTEYSDNDVAPGGKIRDEHFDFNLQHVSGDLKKGETYRLIFK